MKDILEQLSDGDLSVEQAIEMIQALPTTPSKGGDPEVRAVLTAEGIQVQLHNWEGVSMAKVEVLAFEITKAHHQHKANGLHKFRQQEMTTHV